jgi:prevent-host-death family protein
MKLPISDAKARLTDLVRRAEAGEEIVLTRHGHDVVRLAPIAAPVTASTRRRLLEEIRAAGAAKAQPGPDAAHSQDFLYGEEGLPR